MRQVEVGKITLQLESPEAARYRAPILILPGLFQSLFCWRAVSSTLAHRGWEVYLLMRCEQRRTGTWGGWQDTTAQAASAAAALAEGVIVLGSDIGAAIALTLGPTVDALALGLFSPASPAEVGRAYRRNRGWLSRNVAGSVPGTTGVPRRLGKRAAQPNDIGEEPTALINDLMGGVSFDVPAVHPPAIVFAAENDPLVASACSRPFTASAHARQSPVRLNDGRWWPSSEWETACKAVHRFLVLTLEDRVVEFPDEIMDR